MKKWQTLISILLVIMIRHDRPDKTGEIIPLTPGGTMGGSTWEPEHE